MALLGYATRVVKMLGLVKRNSFAKYLPIKIFCKNTSTVRAYFLQKDGSNKFK